MTDKKLHQADKLRNEQNKSKDDKPKNGVPEDFADDVAVQDAHGANRECNTTAAAFTCGASRRHEVTFIEQNPNPSYARLVASDQEVPGRCAKFGIKNQDTARSSRKQFTCSKLTYFLHDSP